MRTGKKLWSLLLALVMVVSLMAGAFTVSAAEDSVTITPKAAVDGETVTLTATGVGENGTVFDMASIGYGTAIQYCLWFDKDGTLSFDKDVTLRYQGTDKASLKAGVEYKIADGIEGGTWSSLYVLLDDGNMLTILEKENPGYFDPNSASTPLEEMPFTVGKAAAAKDEKPAEEPKAEETKAEAPAASGDGYTKASSLEAGKEYLIVTEAGGKYYALTYSGSLGAAEVTVSGDAIASADAAAVWIPDGADHLESKNTAGQFLFASSGGLTTWTSDMLRTFVYDAEAKTVALHNGKYYLAFDGAKFGQANDASGAATILLFTGSGAAAPAEQKPAEKIDYPEPETVKRSAVKNADGSITLAFTSDVHYDGKNMNLKTWLEAADVGYIDAFGFCGDMGSAYAANVEEYWTWVGEVVDYMDGLETAGKVGNAIYTQGNHEWFSPYAGGGYGKEYANYPVAQRLKQVGEGLVTDDYIIYCFGCGSSADGTSVGGLDYEAEDIAELDAYLASAPKDIPIFVLTHMPLHEWYGRSQERYMPHAADVIEVMNKYPNIIVLWGHNHSDFDDNYYAPRFAGDEIVIDPQGTTKTLNFTYLAAGCTADVEYTGPDAGSASCMNKGLIVTIKADGSLEYNYATLDGQIMHIVSPWLVRFRTGLDNYEVFSSQYVEDGKTPAAVTAPEFEDYTFTGWYTWTSGSEEEFDFSAPVTKNTLVTAKYAKVLKPAEKPDELACVTVTPDAAVGGKELTMTAAGVGDQITVFDLSSIGYGSAIMYGFWFEAGGVISFSQDVTLLYQGAATDFTLKAGEFYSTEGFGEHYIQLDDGNDFLILEYDAPGNYASYPGSEPYSAYPGTVVAAAAEPEPAPVEPEPEPEPKPAEEGATYYTVQEGDTLRSISQKFYGTIFKWRLIYEANYDSMVGPDMIYVGQVLLIP